MSPLTTAKPAKPGAGPKVSERTQLMIVLGVALLCGLAASLAMFRFLKTKEQAIASGGAAEAVSIVIARQDLSPGSVLNRLNLEMAAWPKDHLPDSALTNLDQAVGRQVMAKVFRGEPLVEHRLVAQGEHGALQFRIPDGYLAMSLKVSPEVAVSGFMQPGNRVDVIATVKIPRGESLTKVVLQNILVLAVGQETDEKDAEKPTGDVATVTVAVTPEEAEKLAMSKHEGIVVLALRSPKDKREYQTAGFSNSELMKLRPGRRKAMAEVTDDPTATERDFDLLRAEAAKKLEAAKKGVAGKAEAAAPPEKVRVVELIQAGAVSEVKFKE